MFWVMTKRRRRQGRKDGRESEKDEGKMGMKEVTRK